MSVEQIFIKAGGQLTLCELIDQKGNKRLVEPYMVYTSSREKRLFHCYQVEGYSESNQSSGWKNPEIKSFHQARIQQDKKFIPRKEYNPFNETMFPIVHFSIPTADNRKRK
jgi:hypothetical protein